MSGTYLIPVYAFSKRLNPLRKRGMSGTNSRALFIAEQRS